MTKKGYIGLRLVKCFDHSVSAEEGDASDPGNVGALATAMPAHVLQPIFFRNLLPDTAAKMWLIIKLLKQYVKSVFPANTTEAVQSFVKHE